MGDRVVAPNVGGLDLLDPRAAEQSFYPIRTGVTPPPVQPNSLELLGQALSNLNPKINDFLASRQKQQVEQDAQAATQDHLSSAKSWRDAVAAGDVSPDKSPWYVKTWKEMDGQNKGDTLANTIKTQWATDPVSQTADANAMGSWVDQQIAGGLKDITDPDEYAGATSKLSKLRAEMLQAGSAAASANAVEGMKASMGSQMSNTIDEYMHQVKAGGKPFDASELSGLITGTTNMAKFGGMKNKDVSTALLDTVLAKANTYDDPRLLELAKQPHQDVSDPTKTIPGPGMTGQGQLRLADALIQMDSRHMRDQQFALSLQEHAEKQASDQVTREVYDFIHKNGPDTPIPQDLFDQTLKHNPDVAVKLDSYRSAVRANNNAPTPASVGAMAKYYPADGSQPGSSADLMLDIAHGLIPAAEGPRILQDLSRDRDIINRPEVSSIANSMASFVEVPGGPKSLFYDPEIAANAKMTFQRGMLDWAAAHQGYTLSDELDFAGKLRKQVVEHYKDPDAAKRQIDADRALLNKGNQSK